MDDWDKISGDIDLEETKDTLADDWWCIECEHGPMTEKKTSVPDVEQRLAKFMTMNPMDGKTKTLKQKWRKYGKGNDTRYKG